MTDFEPALPLAPAASVRDGNRAAFRAFFDDVYAPLLGYATRLVGDRASAEDLVQEAMVRLWDRREAIPADIPLRAYVYRTVRNLALNARRDDQTRERLLAEVPAEESPVVPRPAPGADAVLEGRELGARLASMLAELPPRQREALLLSRVEGLTHAEVSATMGCAPRTVNNHLVAALATLRRRLSDAGALVAVLTWWIS